MTRLPAQAASPVPSMTMGADALVLANGDSKLSVSFRSPEFVFDDEVVASQPSSSTIKGDILSGKPVEVPYRPARLQDGGELDVRLFLQWSPQESVLRKWASYRLKDASAQPVLKEVVLERLPVESSKIKFGPQPPQSYPAFWDGFFAGIEFPIASTRIENGQLLLAHSPGLRMSSDVWHETRKAVYGFAPKGGERQAFLRYVEANHPSPKGFHINYNSWWTSPVPYTEADIEKLMGVFEEKLFKPYGVGFDSFCIDLGWSETKSVWRINKKLFPAGFTNIHSAAQKMGSDLGLWISPSSNYAPGMNTDWANDRGYETFPCNSPFQTRRACLAGVRYRNALKDRLIEMVTRNGVRQIKMDGYDFACPEATHGHEPGALSAEPLAEGLTSVMNAVRRARPDVWLEPTCFGPYPSPWWLFYANSVTGFFGDDSPYGRVPSPVYRESYTTTRDYFNLQGATHIDIPISCQDILGIDHQSPEPFMNDAVMCVMRGNMFLPLYLNPRFMDDYRWKALAGVLQWARHNVSGLKDTQPLLPASWQKSVPFFDYNAQMPREPYGYAHWNGHRGLVALRNPWIAPQNYSLKLDKDAGFNPGAKDISVVSLYPEARVYAKGLSFGDTVDIALAPYETLVLSLGTGQPVVGVPSARDEVGGRVEATNGKQEVKRVGQGDASSVEIRLEGNIAVTAPQAQLLVLIEGKKLTPGKPDCRISINGKQSTLDTRASIDSCRGVDDNVQIGWAASSLPALEHWRFMTVPLPEGRSDVSVELTAESGCSRVSAWVWATKPGKGDSSYQNALPQPELISLDGAQFMEPVDLDALGGE